MGRTQPHEIAEHHGTTQCRFSGCTLPVFSHTLPGPPAKSDTASPEKRAARPTGLISESSAGSESSKNTMFFLSSNPVTGLMPSGWKACDHSLSALQQGLQRASQALAFAEPRRRDDLLQHGDCVLSETARVGKKPCKTGVPDLCWRGLMLHCILNGITPAESG